MIIKLGNFRKPLENETLAAYFKAAVFKIAGKSLAIEHEAAIQRFVTISIGRANNNQDKLHEAYFYAKGRFKAKGDFHLCADDLLEVA